MDLLLVDRIDKQKDSTRSLISIQGVLSEFKALEDIVRPDGAPKVHGQTAIPADRYLLAMRFSPKFSHEYYTKDDINLIARKDWEKLSKGERDKYHMHDVIWVTGVKNFEFILLHWGNTAADTDGCLIIGSAFGKLGVNSAVLASRAAYIKFYAKVAPLVRQGGQYITYRNSFN
jgi:hypothetical protein